MKKVKHVLKYILLLSMLIEAFRGTLTLHGSDASAVWRVFGSVLLILFLYIDFVRPLRKKRDTDQTRQKPPSSE